MTNIIKLEVYADEVMNEKFLGFGCGLQSEFRRDLTFWEVKDVQKVAENLHQLLK